MPNLARWKKPALVVALVAWAACVSVGMKAILDYQSRPGMAAEAPATWPAASRLPRDPALPTVLVFAHPHCPCTRASLGELARTLSHARRPVLAIVAFVVPPGENPRWADTDLVRQAKAIPHVAVVIDQDAVEARRFGAHTSGQLLYYAADGRLAFAGGITPGRGHMGDNAGGDAVAALAGAPRPLDHGADTTCTPVFGCALDTPTPRKEWP